MMRLIVLCWLIVAAESANCADIAEVRRNFIGVWAAETLTTNYEEFSDVTNFAFYVYDLEVVNTNGARWAKLAGEFVVKGRDGEERLPYPCYPMWLYATNELVAGPPFDALAFTYSLNRTNLGLQGTLPNRSFKATLRKVSKDPGTPRFLPNWAK